MKKVISVVVMSLMLVGCGVSMAKNPDQKAGIYVENKDYEKMASVNITGIVRISEIVSGNDTPTDEMSEKVSKISKANLSVFDSQSKLINTYELKKVEPSTKGEVIKFKLGYKGLPTNAASFRFVFLNNDNSVIYEAEAKSTLKAKTIYDITADLAQVSAKRDVTAPEKITLNIDEKKADQYVEGEFLFGMSSEVKENEIKELFEKNGVKVTELKKGIITNTVKFSAPSLAEALIIATDLKKFDYVEPNGVVTIIGF